jgi:hypothetical protein
MAENGSILLAINRLDSEINPGRLSVWENVLEKDHGRIEKEGVIGSVIE